MFKKHRNIEVLFTFFGYLAFWLFLVSWGFFIFDVFHWHHQGLSLSELVFKKFLHAQLPFQLPLIIYVGTRIKSDVWQRLFAWQTWIFPVSLLLSFSIIVWQFNPAHLYQTALLGFEWNWIAVFEWNILFILQLYLYQKCNTRNFIAFILSYLGVFLGSFLYEIPWFIKTGGIYQSMFLITYMFSFAIFTVLLFREKLKLTLWNFMLFFPVILVWIFYFDIPMWFHRLSVFPFFLSLSITKRMELKQND